MARADEDLMLHVEQVIDRLRPVAEQRGVCLKLGTPPCSLPPAIVAPRFFSEAVIRLVDNGIKFSRPDVESQVIVEAQGLADEVEVTVSDNGVGIGPEQLARIFDPLVQINRQEQEQQGVGLGLSVAKGLIKLHGGRIWAESQLGEGTQVHLTVPRAQPGHDAGWNWSETTRSDR